MERGLRRNLLPAGGKASGLSGAGEGGLRYG